MSPSLAIIGSVVAAGGTVPYVLETVRGKTKPRIVTWLTWALLTGVAAAAAFSAGDFGSGFFALLGTIATSSIVVAGLRYGDRSFKALDIACMAAVVVGLVLWQVFNTPAIAVWAAIIVDCTGFVPTFVHAWRQPHEETASTFALVGVGGLLASLATVLGGVLSVTSLGYPLYASLSMGSCAVLVLLRRRALKAAATTVTPAAEAGEA
jgi:hypothetical protein